MDNFTENLSKFSVRYNEYVCQNTIRQGFRADDYQCTSQEVVDYIIGHIRSDMIDGPFQLNYPNLLHLQSSTIARLIISDHHILVFVKNPNEVLIGQSVRGALAFNYRWTSLHNLYYDITSAVEGGNLITLSGIGIPVINPTIEIQYYSVGTSLYLELPQFTHTEDVILSRLRDQYLEIMNHHCIRYAISGQLITEIECATYLKIKRLRSSR